MPQQLFTAAPAPLFNINGASTAQAFAPGPALAWMPAAPTKALPHALNHSYEAYGEQQPHGVTSAPTPAPAPCTAPRGAQTLTSKSPAARKAANDQALAELHSPVPNLDALRAYSGTGGMGALTDSLNEFYTPAQVVSAMYAAAGTLVSTDKAPLRVLDLACGTGALLAQAPEGSLVVGVEYEAQSAAITRKLLPHASVHTMPAERYLTQSTDPLFDLVIINPPFGVRQAAHLDPASSKIATNEHYFVQKAIERAKHGSGLVVALVNLNLAGGNSHRVWRHRIATHGQVLTSIVVPTSAFSAAGAGVSTVILVIRRHDVGVNEALGKLSLDELTRVLDEYEPEEAFYGGEMVYRPAEGTDGFQLTRPHDPDRRLSENSILSAGRFGQPEYLGKLRVDAGRLSGLRNHSDVLLQTRPRVTHNGVLGQIRTFFGSDVQGLASRAAGTASAWPIPLGTTSPDSLWVVTPEGWAANDDFAAPDVADALTVAGALNRLETASPQALMHSLEKLKAWGKQYREKHGAFNVRKLTRLSARVPLLGLLVAHLDHNGDLEVKVKQAATLNISRDPQAAAERLADMMLLTEASLMQHTGVSRGEAETLLSANYCWNTQVWVRPETYYAGNAVTRSERCRLDAPQAGGVRAAALLKQSREFLFRIQPAAPSDVKLSPRDTTIPLAVLEGWINVYLDSHDAGRPLIAVDRVKGAIKFLLATPQEGRLNLQNRKAVDADAAGKLSRYLNYNTPVARIGDKADLSKDEYAALRSLNIDEAREYERRLEMHFQGWLPGSGHEEAVMAAYNLARRAFLVPQGCTAPLNLADWKGPAGHPFQNMDVRTAAASNGMIFGYEVGLGKALAHGSKVYEASGQKNIEDVRVGDRIMGANGRLTTVLGVFPQGERPTYEVEFSDGSAITCDKEHLWQVLTSNHRNRGQAGRTLTLKEIMAEGLKGPPGRPAKRHFIPMTEAVLFEDQGELPLDPYVLGALLGDGCMTRASAWSYVLRFSTAEQAMLDLIEKRLPPGMECVKIPSARYEYAIKAVRVRGATNPVMNALRTLELAGCTSHTKFIPSVYKFAPVDVRISVLQGLMDTDGHVRPKDNNLEYSTVSPRLAHDMQFLVESLGGTARIREKRDADNQLITYRMSVILPDSVSPFLLPRKAAAYHPRQKYPPCRAIVRVTPKGLKPCTCIRVDAQDALFLTDHFIVTHNTFTALMLIAYLRDLGQANAPVIVVPAGLIGNWATNSARALPGWKVLCVGMSQVFNADRSPRFKKKRDGSTMYDERGQPVCVWKEDSSAVRRVKLGQIVAGQADLVIMSREAFTAIPMSEASTTRLIGEDDQFNAHLENAENYDENSRKSRRDVLTRQIEFAASCARRLKGARSTDLLFERLGFDLIVYDEAHSYKNLYSSPSSYGEVPKFLGGGAESNRALDAVFKGRYTRERGGKTFGLTASWLKNSPLEFSGLLNLVTDDLPAFGLATTEALMDQYLRIEPRIISDLEGGVSVKPAVVGFMRQNELRSIRDAKIFVRGAGDPEVITANGKPLHSPQVVTREVTFDMTPLQLERYQEYRAQARSAGGKGKGDAHLFSVMWRMRKLTADPALVGLDIGEDNPRFVEFAREALRVRAAGGKSLGFLSIGEKEGSFQRLKDVLVRAGYPEHEIEVVSSNSHKGSVRRMDLEDRYNHGDLTLVIGTEVLAEGFNLQHGTAAIIHGDILWNEEGLKQRTGRGARQGNEREFVESIYLLQRGSFDTMTYTIMLGKKAWRAQLDGNADEVENAAASFGDDEIAILMSDDPEATRLLISEKRGQLTERSGRAAVRRRLESIWRASTAQRHLSAVIATAQARKNGWTANDHLRVNNARRDFRRLLIDLEGEDELPLVRTLNFTGKLMWAYGLPVHEGLCFTLDGVRLKTVSFDNAVINAAPTGESATGGVRPFQIRHIANTASDFTTEGRDDLYAEELMPAVGGAPLIKLGADLKVYVMNGQTTRPAPPSGGALSVLIVGNNVETLNNPPTDVLKLHFVRGNTVIHYLTREVKGALVIEHVVVLCPNRATTESTLPNQTLPEFHERLRNVVVLALSA